MKLKRFRVTQFRSVKDSTWIDADDVTALIGTNESGKTNLLIPLWKLNPAKDGEINPLIDYPRKRYHEIVPQIEAFAKKHSIELELGWKVELAKMFVAKVLRNPEAIDAPTAEKWKVLFDRLEL